MKKVAMILLAVSLMVSFVFIPAFAGSEESAWVVDKAGVFKKGLEDVDRAAGKIQAVGGDIHVWTLPSYEGEATSLSDFFEKLKAKFPTWRPTHEVIIKDGKIVPKSNLIVLIMSLKERKASLFYGGDWRNPLDGSWIRIQTDFMNPRFKEGKFADGFVAGLGEIERLIYAHLHPQGSSAPQQIVVHTQAVPATDYSGLWSVMKWGLGIIFFFGFIAFVYVIYTKNEDNREKAKNAEQKARMARENVREKLDLVNDRIGKVKGLFEAVLVMVIPGLAARLKEEMSAIEKKRDRATETFNLNSLETDKRKTLLLPAQYKAIEEKHEEILDSLMEMFDMLNDLEQKIDGIQDLFTAASQSKESFGKSIIEISGLIAEAEKQGFVLDDSKKILETVKQSFSSLDDFAKKGDSDGFYKMVQEINHQFNEIRMSAEELPKLEGKIQQSADEAEKRIDSVKNLVVEGRRIYVQLEKDYVQRSLEAVHGNGTEAENRVNWALGNLNKIRELSQAKDEQKLREAQELSEKTNGMLDKAESLMGAIFSLKENLDRLKASIPEELAQVESSIKKAHDYLEENSADVDKDLERELKKKAEEMIASVRKDIQAQKPDYTKVIKMIHQAAEMADEIYKEALDEHETAEKQRRKVESKRKEAERALSRARDYANNHRRHVDSETQKRLAEAEANLERARSESDFNQTLALIALCQNNSNHTYETARSDSYSAPRYEHSDNSNDISYSRSWGSPTTYSSARSDDEGGGGSTNWSSSSSLSGGGGETTFDTGSLSGGGGETSW